MNTSYDYFRVILNGMSLYSATNNIDWSYRLEPGQNYKVMIETIHWRNYDYEKHSIPLQEEITTMRKWQNSRIM